MKIALIGASGFVGTAVLNEALDRGHEVTAIARHPEKIGKKSESLHLKEADAYDEQSIADAVAGHDIVISTFNPGWQNPNIHDDFLRGAQAIQAGVRRSGVKRFLTVGGAGSLYVAPGMQLVDTPQFPQEWKAGALAARDYLNILKKEQELDWTFLSPAIEMHQGTAGERRGTYRTGDDEPVFDGDHRSIISVEDMAIAIIDEAEQPKHIKKRFTVAW